MSLASGLSAALGFVYWVVAAKSFSASAVGLAGALIAIMNTVGLFGDLGLATIFAGRAKVFSRELPRVFSGAALFACTFSLLLGLSSVAVLHFFESHSADLLSSTSHVVLFIVGVEMCALTLLTDNLAVGLLKSWVQLVRSVCFSVLKLGFLIVVATLGVDSGISIFLAWIAGGLVSLILSAILLPELKGIFAATPHLHVLRNMRGAMFGHHLINCATQGPALLIPAFATLLISPDAGGPFYITWQIFSILLLVPASLSTALYAVSSSAEGALAQRLGFTLATSLAFSLLASVLSYASAPLILGIFNPSYAETASSCLIVLSTSVAAASVKCHFVAVCRIREALISGGLLLIIAAAVEIFGAAVGAWRGGITGLAVGFSVASFVEIVMYLPALVSCMRSSQMD
ncbi:hypothetical protein ACRAWG_27590 [Methylobacterium sp. P31]